MKLENQNFGRVSVLILNYNVKDNIDHTKLVLDAYDSLSRYLNQKYIYPSNQGTDVILLANKNLIAKHKRDFEERGLIFFPNWYNSNEYSDLFKEGLRQGTDIYLMRNINEKRAIKKTNRYNMNLVNLLDNSEIEI